MHGKLIVFEGGEGCGKTTQIQHLHRWLETQRFLQLLQTQNMVAGVKRTREPGGTELGQKIRQLLLAQQGPEEAPLLSKTELLLYAADRAQHVEETLRPWLAQGYWVLCDRYTDSTVAYQGYGRQLDLPLINTLNQIATGGLKSDLTLWLSVSPEVGLGRAQQRGSADRIEQASRDFHQRVNAGFTTLAAESALSTNSGSVKSGSVSSGPIAKVDASGSIEAVSARVQTVIRECVPRWYPAIASDVI